MASKIALAFLSRCHSGIEIANFSAGYGIGKFADTLPYHAIEMTERTGDSKRTIGHYPTLESARAGIAEMDANRADTGRGGSDTLRRDITTRYIRDIRNGQIHRAQ